MSGPGRPGIMFKAKCVARDGPQLTFLSHEISITSTFHQQEDADYFQVGKEYAIGFNPAASGDSGGPDSPTTQPDT